MDVKDWMSGFLMMVVVLAAAGAFWVLAVVLALQIEEWVKHG